MNEETDRRIRKKMFAKLLDDICRTHSYYISTTRIYDPINFKGYYTISVANRTRFRTTAYPYSMAMDTDDVSEDTDIDTTDCFVMPYCNNIYSAVDEWVYIRTLYTCALSCQDEEVINDIESVCSSLGIEIRTDDILADINDLVERYTSPELANGELVAWLMEFKKRRFGFENKEETL